MKTLFAHSPQRRLWTCAWIAAGAMAAATLGAQTVAPRIQSEVASSELSTLKSSLHPLAQAQFDAGPPVPADSTVLPGDLLFYGSGPSGVDHVGLYVGDGEMIDAPHTGALVRVESAGWTGLAGATRPG